MIITSKKSLKRYNNNNKTIKIKQNKKTLPFFKLTPRQTKFARNLILKPCSF